MSRLLVTTSGVAILVGGSIALGAPSGSTDLTVSIEYTETDDSGNVISPGAAWLSVTGGTGWDKSFSATGDGEYIPALCEIEYYWEISHASADFSARSGLNLPSSPAAFRDCSKQRGSRVCFPLPESGAYTYTLFAYEPSSGKTYNSGSVTLTTTVTEADAFPGTRTICYSRDNIFTDAPFGSDNYSDLASLQARLASLNAGSTSYRLLLRRGETYAGSNIDFTWPTTFPNFRSGTYGSGDDPVVEAPFLTPFFEFPSGGASKHVWIGPIWWKGRWDTVNERGYLDGERSFEAANAAGTFVCHGVRHSGVMIGFSLPGEANSHFAAINCDFRDYRVFGTNADGGGGAGIPANRTFAFIGTLLGCVSDCVGGSEGRTGTGEWESPLCNAALGGGGGWILRLYDPTETIIQHCELTQGFTGATDTIHQGALRANTEGAPGAIYSIAFTSFESGTIDTNTANRAAINLTMDACLLVASGLTGGWMVRLSTTGAIVRNSYFYVGGMTTRADASGNAHTPIVGIDTDGGTDNKPYPIKVYNNTYFSKRDIFYHETQLMSANGYDDLTFENNLKRDSGDTDIIEVAIAGWSPRYTGRKPGFPTIPVTLGGTWNQTETFDILFTNALLNEQDGTPTTQAYWDATVLTGDTFHMIRLSDGNVLYADAGDFTMTVLSDRLRFTNVAAGNITAQNIHVKVDRASELPTPDGAYAADAAGQVVWAEIAAASEASLRATAGLISYRDIENTVRGTPAYNGAVEYAA